ncbi:MAG: hypothetical protein J4F43_06470 [Dehalococcoidia bacterium]|nr:hypothetical protein [Dehalococcoidia bacterium]
MDTNKHNDDLVEFFRQNSFEMMADYERIQSRSREDPGTAGDQGEENWAELLRDWLSPVHQIVTKGRILGATGIASHQIDVIVLKDAYPKRLVSGEVGVEGHLVQRDGSHAKPYQVRQVRQAVLRNRL